MRATYFDGRSSLARDVELRIEGGAVIVVGEAVERREPVDAVEITDAIGSTPRLLRFVDGASCEASDNDAFAAMLATQGVAPGRVSRWEKSWQLAAAALLVVALAGVLAYRYGLPVMARTAAEKLPDTALDSLSLQIQRVLDRTIFSRTHVDGHRLASLLNSFDALKMPGHAKDRLRLEFRQGGRLGANAMALPSGAVFVTDELVALTDDDRLVMAVIAHEAGHVDKRHGLQKIIQSSVVGILVTWYLGDVSALGAAAPTALLEAKYSRDLERDADAYAAQLLRLNGLPPSLLADALELIEKSHGIEGLGGNAGALAYLSTHPATADRLAWLRSQPR